MEMRIVLVQLVSHAFSISTRLFLSFMAARSFSNAFVDDISGKMIKFY